jgi:hypothetical protein
MEKVIELYNVFDEAEELKKQEIINVNGIDFELQNTDGDFEKQNNKVFMINLYILIKLYNKEFNSIKEKYGEFKLDQYYELVENLDLPDSIHEMYISMPKMINNNKILSYATDIPSYMGMKKTN